MATEQPDSRAMTAQARLKDATLGDLEAMRLLLRGGSVIDWNRIAFSDEAAVDRFLKVNEFDPQSAADLERLEELRGQAVEYLTKNFSYRIPDEVAHAMPVKQLLLLAASKGRRQVYACIILKVMHVMHHLAGRELLFKLPVSDNEVFGFVENKVVKAVEEIRGAGYPIVEFAWSRKEHDSVVTKLLAKKASLAAQVYDKLRFRLITRTRADLAPVLHELLQRLVPFNYVVPGESVNDILPFRQLVEDHPSLARHADQLQHALDVEEIAHAAARPRIEPPAALTNEFSGPSYRVINFVVDLPVRVDQYLCNVDDPNNAELGAIIFVLTEFQMMDAQTAQNNEQGENSHQAYKMRQHERVKLRLAGPAYASNAPSDDDDD